MCAGGGDPQTILARQPDDLAAQTHDLAPRLRHILADRSADLDYRVVHLALDLFLQALLTLREHLLDVRFELAGFRINDLKLFFDPEGEGRLHYRGASAALSTGIFFGQLPVSSSRRSPVAISSSTSAMLFTTHSKLLLPTDLRSASGAQFMKSIAYGMPSRTASSTVFMS